SRYVRSSDSFLSHHDLRIHFGLGPIDEVDRIAVDWPDGTSEEFESGKVDRLLLLQMGTGRKQDP
ncbi:MAG: ASPIC/UnbV domain-containing protein, partial [Acidobacteria bacterium]|nr:ASPIC/UnbV domain-containing protein [Acidobacteriota bacterium]